MAEFLLVSLRNGPLGPEVAAAEHRDVLRATGLAATDVELRVLADTGVSIGGVDKFAGVIVGGSSLSITSPEYSPWQKHVHAQLRGLLDSRVPVFFICFGMSWLVDALGGSIGHSAPEASGPTLVELTDAGRRDPLMRGFPDSFRALTGHTENPAALPADLEVLATGPTCPVQVARWGGRVWATQFHAEMDADAMRVRMDFYYDYGYFPLAEYDTIVAMLPSVDVRWSNELLRRFVAFCREPGGGAPGGVY
ncbi:glutamine amidotransferase [Corynebacterium sp. UBA2622]|uniref:glutamine amidotransferase n=1 Tax=Corynebacterium sp. UBA2622 TaxID=1946393 RepID=UPI0025C69702|nr:glutamine amidotransferase [Corynebacterium sp. UBA2622]